jgi:hypothetical protein
VGAARGRRRGGRGAQRATGDARGARGLGRALRPLVHGRRRRQRRGELLRARGAIAIAGLYALSREETVYYTAFTDSEGRELDGRCDYTLAGRPPPSRWWSFTLYGADHYLVDNPAHVYSRHAGNLALESDGGFRIAVSPAPQPRNWLPAPASGGFSITARLYNPEPALLRDLAGAPLPTIERGACR